MQPDHYRQDSNDLRQCKTKTSPQKKQNEASKTCKMNKHGMRTRRVGVVLTPQVLREPNRLAGWLAVFRRLSMPSISWRRRSIRTKRGFCSQDDIPDMREQWQINPQAAQLASQLRIWPPPFWRSLRCRTPWQLKNACKTRPDGADARVSDNLKISYSSCPDNGDDPTRWMQIPDPDLTRPYACRGFKKENYVPGGSSLKQKLHGWLPAWPIQQIP